MWSRRKRGEREGVWWEVVGRQEAQVGEQLGLNGRYVCHRAATHTAELMDEEGRTERQNNHETHEKFSRISRLVALGIMTVMPLKVARGAFVPRRGKLVVEHPVD